MNINSQFVALLGVAGSGKSFTIQQYVKEDPNFAIRCSTTGISAMNIGGYTINSILKYYDTNSLLAKFLDTGSSSFKNFINILKLLARKYKYLVIDEIGMMSSTQLDLIKKGVDIANNIEGTRLGILVTGDPAQLPPILKGLDKAPFFKANCWKEFDIYYLTKVYRQENQEFVEVLNKVRLGKANEAALWIEENIGFHSKVDENFEGTTIFSKNEMVDYYNQRYLDKLTGPSKKYPRVDRGKLLGEWNCIPNHLELKVGCLVVLLRNNSESQYVNGDLAEVLELFSNSVLVKIKRTSKEVVINYVTQDNIPVGSKIPVGSVKFLPIRVAKSLSLHKTQGLTLTKLQFRLGESFLSRLSGGLYVALSRINEPSGLRLVGDRNSFINSVYIDDNYLEFLKDLENYKSNKELVNV